MTAPETAVLWCRGPEAGRRRFYRALARAVNASRAPTTAAFVTATDVPDVRLVVRPRAVVDVVRSELPFSQDDIPEGRTLPAFAPPPGTTGRIAAAVVYRKATRSEAPRDPIDLPSLAPLLGPAGWFAAQTFWVGGAGRGLWAARRWWVAAASRSELLGRFEAVSTAVADDWGSSAGAPARPQPLRLGAARDWARLGVRTFPRGAWTVLRPERVDATPEVRWAPGGRFEAAREGHAVVLGASGAGKSWFLADRAAAAIERGEPVVALDLHGDLAPAIVARLDGPTRARTVCIDLADSPVPGVAALPPTATPERAAAHLVAALKRLSPDGTEIYWGFRLERIFEAFVRLVQESGGSLVDLYALLTDPDRRDAARLATRYPELARFLEELAPVVRRTPDFLWSASARLAKVVEIPPLEELLAPADGGLPVEDLLRAGRAILVRIPFAQFGPEAASFAGTLVLARTYLGVAAGESEGRRGPATTVVLDEVQGFSPRLVAEMLAEGRKFGVRLLIATQFPERMTPELRSAVTGVVRDFVVFRIPRPSAAVAGGWLGLAERDSERWLTDLPPGHGLARSPDHPFVRSIAPVAPPGADPEGSWTRAVAATRREFGTVAGADRGGPSHDTVTERLLLAVLAAEEHGRPIPMEGLVAAAEQLPGPAVDPAALADRIGPMERQGYLRRGTDGVHLTPSGERRLGLGAPTGATRESAAHRGLLLAAFRVFARRGHVLEIVRQGRYDTRLPDALYRQVPERCRAGTPGELAEALDRIRTGWAWRFFGGRDVHVEAEVSGALRPARIRHGAGKARARGAFVLFLVTDGHRAARVRATLKALSLGPDRAQVWTLPPVRADGNAPEGASPSIEGEPRSGAPVAS